MVQEQGGCLIFCTMRRQCELHALALVTAITNSQAPPAEALRTTRLQLAMDLMTAQGGEMLAPLREILLSCAGVAYHHAGEPQLAPAELLASILACRFQMHIAVQHAPAVQLDANLNFRKAPLVALACEYPTWC